MKFFKIEFFQISFWQKKIISLLMVLFLIGLWQLLEQTTWLKTANSVLYDSLIRSNVLFHKIREDVVIIAIDDKSVGQIGRWPWSRDYHTQLLRSLKSSKAVAFDILFTEKTNEDYNFQSAITNHQKVVLPVFLNNIDYLGTSNNTNQTSEINNYLSLETPIYNHAFLAHIHPEIDSDGVVRSAFLREGMDSVEFSESSQHFWQLIPALLLVSDKLASEKALLQKIVELTQIHPMIDSKQQNQKNIHTWQRRYLLHIPFVGKPDSIHTVSYVDVINGTIEPDFFTDKYVLIGATATGLGDRYPTPVSGESKAMAGIEIHANILHALLNQQSIKVPIHQDGWNELPLFPYLASPFILGALILVLRSHMNTKKMMLGLFGLWIGIIMTNLLLWHYGYFWSFIPCLVVLLLVYPLWAWFRLYQTMSYLTQEADVLTLENKLQPVIPELIIEENIKNVKKDPFFAPFLKLNTENIDSIEYKITKLHELIAQVRNMREFVSNSMNHLPDACLVINRQGIIISGNEQAEKLFEYWTFSDRLSGVKADFLTSLFNPPLLLQLEELEGLKGLNYLENLKMQQKSIEPQHFYTQGLEKDWQINRSICFDANQNAVGMIFNFSDITPLKQAERERNDTLRFLSHDLRSPQSIILTLVEMQEADYEALGETMPDYLQNIKKQAKKTIELAEDFVQLAKAEGQTYTLAPCVINWLTHELIDEYFTLARKKNITITNLLSVDELYILGEENLLRRAIGNLLSNAIKYSPEKTCIEISCEVITKPINTINSTNKDDEILNSHSEIEQEFIHLIIKDQGYGMTKEQSSKIFQKFQRFHADKADGIGLGMPFVKTVIDKHHATIICESMVGKGTTFTIIFERFTS